MAPRGVEGLVRGRRILDSGRISSAKDERNVLELEGVRRRADVGDHGLDGGVAVLAILSVRVIPAVITPTHVVVGVFEPTGDQATASISVGGRMTLGLLLDPEDPVQDLLLPLDLLSPPHLLIHGVSDGVVVVEDDIVPFLEVSPHQPHLELFARSMFHLLDGWNLCATFRRPKEYKRIILN